MCIAVQLRNDANNLFFYNLLDLNLVISDPTIGVYV